MLNTIITHQNEHDSWAALVAYNEPIICLNKLRALYFEVLGEDLPFNIEDSSFYAQMIIELDKMRHIRTSKKLELKLLAVEVIAAITRCEVFTYEH